MKKVSRQDYLKALLGAFSIAAGIFLLTDNVRAAEIDPPACWPASGVNHNAFGQAGRQKLNFPAINYPSTYVLTGIKVYGMKVGSPTDNVVVSVYEGDATTGSSGYISGSLLTSATLSGAAWPSGAHDIIEITFDTEVVVMAGDDLAFQFSRSGANSGTDYYRLNGQSSCTDGVETDNLVYWSGAAWVSEGEGPRMITLGSLSPYCVLESASIAWSNSGRQTIHSTGSCGGFYPTTAWVGAVRYDPIGVHAVWSEGYGPFADPYALDTADLPHQTLPNGRYRVRMYATDGGTQYVSSNYIDVTLDGDPFGALTTGGDPGNWQFSEDDTPLSASTTGAGYTFSASAAAIAGAGGLGINREGCAAIGEDATSTECVFAENNSFLRNHFPLLTWPAGIFDAFYDAYQDFAATSTPAYDISIAGDGEWIPDLTLVNSASSGAGIGKYITPSMFLFFRSVLELSLWLFFVRSMYRKYQSLL